MNLETLREFYIEKSENIEVVHSLYTKSFKYFVYGKFLYETTRDRGRIYNTLTDPNHILRDIDSNLGALQNNQFLQPPTNDLSLISLHNEVINNYILVHSNISNLAGIMRNNPHVYSIDFPAPFINTIDSSSIVIQTILDFL